MVQFPGRTQARSAGTLEKQNQDIELPRPCHTCVILQDVREEVDGDGGEVRLSRDRAGGKTGGAALAPG